MYIDAIWLIPTVVTTAVILLAFRLGVEVGKDHERRLQRAKDRHPAGSDLRSTTGNVIHISTVK